MQNKIIFLDKENEGYLNDIREILLLCDNEFIPTLSSRGSTSESHLKPGEGNNNSIEEYFKGICSQNTLIITNGVRVVAFMSFKENYTCPEIPETSFPNIYVTTVIVHPFHRGKRLTESFYEFLLDKFKGYNLFTRTWSKNGSHLHILDKMGFDNYLTKENDRGEGIHTVYFAKRS